MNLDSVLRTSLKLWVLLLSVLVICITAHGQYNETIRSGRPGQSIGPYGVGKNIFQVQFGGVYSQVNQRDIGFESSVFSSGFNLRFGLGEVVEINSAWSFQHSNQLLVDSSYQFSGINYSSIGTRINLLNGKAYVPSIGVQVSLNLPIRSPDFKVDYLATRALLIVRQKLWNKGSLLMNGGLDYNGVLPNPAALYTIALNLKLSDKWSVFVENFGNHFNDKSRIGLNAGGAFLATPNLQFDLFGGINFENNNLNPQISCGVSWRTKRK